MAKCHQLLISKLPSLEAHNTWWCSDAKRSFCFQFPTYFFFYSSSSRIMNKNSVQGGAFLSNFSCAYAGTHERQRGEIASHLPGLGPCTQSWNQVRFQKSLISEAQLAASLHQKWPASTACLRTVESLPQVTSIIALDIPLKHAGEALRGWRRETETDKRRDGVGQIFEKWKKGSWSCFYWLPWKALKTNGHNHTILLSHWVESLLNQGPQCCTQNLFLGPWIHWDLGFQFQVSNFACKFSISTLGFWQTLSNFRLAGVVLARSHVR